MTGAIVVVLEEGLPVDTLAPVEEQTGESSLFQPTHRSLHHSPVPGKTYTLQVSAPGYPTAEATSFAPAAVPFAVEITGTPGSAEEEITIRFTDPPGVPNYYKLEIIQEITYLSCPTCRNVQPLLFQSADPLLVEGELVGIVDDGNAPVFPGPAYFSGEQIDVFSEIEPVRVYSNVEHGMGIFAGSSAYTQEIAASPEGP